MAFKNIRWNNILRFLVARAVVAVELLLKSWKIFMKQIYKQMCRDFTCCWNWETGICFRKLTTQPTSGNVNTEMTGGEVISTVPVLAV